MHVADDKKVIVGLSGGVDSSVSAYLLQQQGYHVEGLFMKNWEEDDTQSYCAASIDVADAKAVCDKLNIPLHTVNFAADYWQDVFETFLAEYAAGRTPNPDILCNKYIKFKAFLLHALDLGADYIATGHYVRCTQDGHQIRLMKGLDHQKDQSYFLYTLNQQQLSKSLFPIGHLRKSQVRALAQEIGLSNHAKKDSTGICFIGERKFKTFLSTYLPAQPGNIKTTEGEIVGEHDGLMYYTIGQRKGIGIGGMKSAEQKPWYVIDKDIKNNVLIVGQDHQHPRLLSHQLSCSQTHWISGEEPTLPLNCQARIRYRQADQKCTINKLAADRYQILFPEPQRAVALGQSIVFYLGNNCLGGGIIESYE